MTIILGFLGTLSIYFLVHLGVMYLHAKYELFKGEETCEFLHFVFMLFGAVSFLAFILFLASL